uniref:Uncharacterized protein n=1 Tax=Rhizophora mucronata TaxID=61149 RepID=A0A2P2Q1Z5_RHIMU
MTLRINWRPISLTTSRVQLNTTTLF